MVEKQPIADDLPDYDIVIDDANDEPQAPVANAVSKVTKPHVGVHSSSFKDMMLRPELQQSILDCGFEHPSDVQQKCIPQAIIGVDILCQAVSGMGKTAVFVLSILHNLNDNPEPFSALILAHTRELAYQIKGEFKRLAKFIPDLRIENIIGGDSLEKQKKMLKGQNLPHIVVGTPGRILHLVKDKALNLDKLKIFVLDECDKVLENLDMRGAIVDIFKRTPVSKQVMMFTATLSNDIKTTCRRFMRNPAEILIEKESKLTLHGLCQYYVSLEESKKIAKLMDLIDELQFNQVIIFVSHVNYAVKLNEVLNKNSFPSKAIYSRLPLEERLKIYEGFKQFKYRILVATELFGRGIDIEKINIVFNFDMPGDADSYLHRVGRAGRFGTKGLAITFVSSDKDRTVLQDIQDRFEVSIGELPTVIDSNSYMNN